MSVMESLVTRRTYRRFAQKPVPQDVVDGCEAVLDSLFDLAAAVKAVR